MFEDRRHAGRRLGARLAQYRATDPMVIGLPRGGVVVALEVARALEAPLDVVVVRKLRAPNDRELGIGALAGGASPEVVLDEALSRHSMSRPSMSATRSRRSFGRCGSARLCCGKAGARCRS
jgi:putative phosphoribosyl transferase